MIATPSAMNLPGMGSASAPPVSLGEGDDLNPKLIPLGCAWCGDWLGAVVTGEPAGLSIPRLFAPARPLPGGVFGYGRHAGRFYFQQMAVAAAAEP